jgi:hypothetical protein
MNPKIKNLLSRKDLAELMDITPEQVRKNEVRWGLRIARRDLNRRCVRYLASLALPTLRSLGFIA